MVTTTVREARLNLSRFLKLVEKGGEVEIRNRNTPVAILVPPDRRKNGQFPDLSRFRRSIASSTRYVKRRTEDLVREDREGRG